MPYKIHGRVDGLAEAVKALDGVKKALRNKLLRKGLNKARSVLAKAAKAKAPRETGLLKKSIGGKVKIYPTGVGVAVVGPRVGFRKEVVRRRKKWFPVSVVANPVKYAHLVELGTSHAGARPFLAPAFAAGASAVREAIAGAVRDGLAAAAKGGP